MIPDIFGHYVMDGGVGGCQAQLEAFSLGQITQSEYMAALQAAADENTRWPLALARRYAEWLRVKILPGCTKAVIAGSVRRERADVGDVELVVEPRGAVANGKQAGLFDGDGPTLAGILAELEAEVPGEAGHPPQPGALIARAKNAGGKAQKYLLNTRNTFKGWGMYPRLKLDLFIVTPPAEFGAILAIRTGPGDYSKWLVTAQAAGGAMPTGLVLREGALWRDGQKVPTPNEDEFFRALGLAYVEPMYRTPGAGRI